MITIVQTVLPSYRGGFFQILVNKHDCNIVAGYEYFVPSVTTDIKIFHELSVKPSRNSFIFGRRFLMQTWSGMFNSFSSSIRVVEMNPRCIFSWISLISSSYLGLGKTILWGHLTNRKGHYSPKSLRGRMMALAEGCVFYTQSQENKFLQLTPNYKGVVGFAPNSVLFESEVMPSESIGTDFCYVGRLVSDKKVELLIKAFIRTCNDGNSLSKLHIVGTGPEETKLKCIASNSPISERIIFYGHQSDSNFLKAIYEKSICSVSPGYVGLSITQSYSYGRPMIIAREEPHSPEIDIFIDKEYGYYFESDSIDDLAKKLRLMVDERDCWAKKNVSMTKVVLNNYTYEKMADGFMKVINAAASL